VDSASVEVELPQQTPGEGSSAADGNGCIAVEELFENAGHIHG